MKAKRFSEAQILNVWKEYESGISAVDLSRKHGVGESTIYAWHSKYGGIGLSELRRLKQLEEENARLKRMYTTLSMDFDLMKEALKKKSGQDLSDEKWRGT